MTRTRFVVGAALLASCVHGSAVVAPSLHRDGTRVLLGTERATVIERRTVTGSHVRVPIAAGLSLAQLSITVEGPATVTATALVPDGHGAIDLALERHGSGALAVTVAYPTEKLNWLATYDVVMNDDRATTGQLTAAIKVTDDGGPSLRDADVEFFATPSPPGGDSVAPQLSRRLTIIPGDVHIALTTAAVSVPIHRAMIFDALGSGFDRHGRVALADKEYAQHAVPSTEVYDGYQLAMATTGVPLLPGDVVLRHRIADGTLAELGSSLTFVGGASADPFIARSLSDAVIGIRLRTDFSFDAERNRVVEEFTVLLSNDGKQPATVLVREHLFRGQNWTLAFHSDDAEVSKEGPQQITLAAHVPAAATTKVMYRVVYSW